MNDKVIFAAARERAKSTAETKGWKTCHAALRASAFFSLSLFSHSRESRAPRGGNDTVGARFGKFPLVKEGDRGTDLSARITGTPGITA